MIHKDVHVELALDTGITKLLGFGKPLIIGMADTEAGYKNYSSLTEVAEDFETTDNVYKMASQIFAQKNGPKEIAIAMATSATNITTLVTNLFDEDWYFLLSEDTTVTNVQAIAEIFETKDSKMFVTRSYSTSDIATLKGGDYKRTICFYTNEENIGEYPDCALVGALGSRTVGSITWKAQTLTGVTPISLTTTELATIHANNCLCYLTKAGDNVTSEGKTLSGQYIDIVHSMDYIINNIEYEVQKLINREDKIPYTNTGIAMIEAVNLSVLQRAYTNGMISDTDGTPNYSTQYGKVEETTAADRNERKYRLGTFQFKLAGAIHEVWIKGTVTI